MKRNGNIVSLFRKHEAKAKKIATDQERVPVVDLMVEEQNQEQEPRSVLVVVEEQNQEVLIWDDNYVSYGRSVWFYPKQSNDDHFRREVYLGVIDKINQELDSRFDEVNMELLVCISILNPFNSFASYDAQKVLRLVEIYPKDISSIDLIRLEIQLDNFIDDMRNDDRFKGLNNLGELSIRL